MMIGVELKDEEAWACSQFLKRIGLSDFRSLAASDSEAYEMQSAGEKIRKALFDAGYSPR